MRRLISIAALSAGIVAGAAAPAHALVGGGAGRYTFPMVCDGQAVTLTIANGRWSAAYVRETGGRFVPKGTSVSVRDLQTGELLYEASDMKPSASSSSTTCIDAWENDGILVTFQVYGTMR